MSVSVEKYKVCRSCLTENGTMFCIYDTKIFGMLELQIYEMIHICTSVQTSEGDGLPDQMCLRCVEELTRAVLFKRLCEESDTVLRNLFVSKQKDDSKVSKEFEIEFIDLKDPLNDYSVEIGETPDLEDTFNEIDENTSLLGIDTDCESSDYNSKTSVTHNKSQFVDCNSSFGDAPQEIQISDKRLGKSNNRKRSLQCKVCNKAFPQISQLRRHLLAHARLFYICKTCDKTFTNSLNLKAHEQEHLGLGPLSCEVCKKHFNSKFHLNLHLSTHTRVKLHKCNECGKCFDQLKALEEHKRTHAEEKPYFCPVCEKTFDTSAECVSHTKTHTEQEPFECVLCKACFTKEAHLKEHVKSHTDKKPFACEECGQSFRLQITLIDHMKQHSDEPRFVCEVCGRTFLTMRSVKMHRKLHDGRRVRVVPEVDPSKPFLCDGCGMGFRFKSVLLNHLVTHKEKELICETCGRTFEQHRLLVRHKRLVHKGHDRKRRRT